MREVKRRFEPKELLWFALNLITASTRKLRIVVYYPLDLRFSEVTERHFDSGAT
jgi:hypothetical protein